MNEQSAPQSSLDNSTHDFSLPKASRLLRPSEFRRVYDNGARVSNSLFTSFLLARDEASGPRIGFTLPRALGKAVRRNRMRRRLREAIRLEFHRVSPRWDIVINPRKALESASWESIQKEVRRLVTRCGN
jgi:ribonuclease P protein component